MEALVGFAAANGRGVYRPTGVASAGQAADMISAVLDLAQAGGLTTVLVDITGLTGFEIPGPAFRRWAVRRWAAAAADLRVAVVARPEHICPEKTGLLVAAEEGMRAHICASKAEAIAWLDARQP
jgi:hypothetical protein